MAILVTGGAGYIGSHACLELIESGFEVIVADNLSNSSKEAIARVEKITKQSITFYEVDILDEHNLDSVFNSHDVSGVVHCAGLKSVSESAVYPAKYYSNNVSGSLSLLKIMNQHQCKNIIFSSSATVYGPNAIIPIQEESYLDPINPYGQSKLMIEKILCDLYAADSSWKIALLRYFNPVGAHKSGLIGEDPSGIPTNLMPLILGVASGKYDQLEIFGSDYDTIDGTGVRDYIHVVDLAKAHVKALKKILSAESSLIIANIGTGKGTSVFELLNAFQYVSGKSVPYTLVERRKGDLAESYADPSYANRVLAWEAEYGIEKMCEDAWRWQSMNPDGYKSS